MRAANPSVIIRYPVITLHSCYPFTSLLWIGGKSVKLDTAILPNNWVSGKRGLADSAGNTEFRILRLNHITCGMFIAPRDVSDKMDEGEGSHGTSML